MKKWLLFFSTIFFTISAMRMEEGSRARSRSTDEDMEELAHIVSTIFLAEAEPCVLNKLNPKIKKQIQLLRERHDEDHQRIMDDLRDLRTKIRSMRRHSRSPREGVSMVESDVLRKHLSQVVNDAIREEFNDMEDNIHTLEGLVKSEEKQKYAAIACGVISTLIASATALIVNFIEKPA